MIKVLRKSNKKIISLALVLTMLFSMCIVVNAQTTLTASDTVGGANVSMSHEYSWAKVNSRLAIDKSTKNKSLDITMRMSLRDNRDGKVSNISRFNATSSNKDVACSYTRPSSSYTITHSSSTYIYTYGGKTKSKALGA